MSAKEEKNDNGGSEEVCSLLEKTQVSSLVPEMDVITVGSNDDLFEAFNKLSGNNILSAPCKDAKTGKFKGFLDMRDLVSYVVLNEAAVGKKNANAKAAEEKKDSSGSGSGDSLAVPGAGNQVANANSPFLKAILSSGAAPASMPGSSPAKLSVGYLAARNPFFAVNATDSLLDVAKILIKPKVHRVAVVNKDGKVTSIISQSTIIKFLQASKDKLGKAWCEDGVDKLGLGSSPVLTIKDNDSALTAFQTIDKKNLSGIAIVSAENGRLVGNTSASDIKLFLSEPSFDLLSLSVIEFLGKIRAKQMKTVHPTVAVGPSGTLERVIGKLAATRMHRVFVANSEAGFKPEKVISLTDILRHVLGA